MRFTRRLHKLCPCDVLKHLRLTVVFVWTCHDKRTYISVGNLLKPQSLCSAPYMTQQMSSSQSTETQRIYLSDLLPCFGCFYSGCGLLLSLSVWNNEWAQTSMWFEVDLLCWPAVNFSRLEKGRLRHRSQPFLFCRGMIDRWNMRIIMICIAVMGSQWRCDVTSPDFSSDLCFILWSDSGWVFQEWRLHVQKISKKGN